MRNVTTKRWIQLGLLALLGLLLILLPQYVKRYTVFILYLICLNVSLAQSWNLLGGYTGLISLGHAAFFGIGAYTSSMLITFVPVIVIVIGVEFASIAPNTTFHLPSPSACPAWT